ncbi:MAG: tRNA-guanine transglycosylase [Candidatus Methanoperedens sp.]|nr:tRNA-guanine transglycosylase [Candidatus Methanoperedens sp.]
MLARISTIKTSTNELETPVLFPVHNAGSRGKGNSPKYWEHIPDMKTMMLNAYFIKENPIYNILSNVGLHDYFKFDGTFFVDSGGLQGRLYDLKLNPIEILRIQEGIGADIASTLDIPILPQDNITNLQHANYLKTSIKNAILSSRKKQREDMLLFAAIHGNDISVMMNTVDYLNKKGNFDGFAIGGLVAKRSDFRKVVDIVIAVRKKIGDKPLHVFGLGGPSMIPLLTYLGVDSFDSSSFLKAGSKRIYFVPGEGSIEFREMEKLNMLPCVCPVCSDKTFEEVRGKRKLIALHNLWAICYEIRKLKMKIQDGTLEEYLDTRFVFNPLINTAYKYAKAKVRGFA